MTVEALLERLLTELPARIAEALRQGGPQQPLTIVQAARFLRVRKDVIRSMVARGEIRTVPWTGNRKRIPPTEITRLQTEGVQAKPKRRSRKKVEPPDDPAEILKIEV